MESQTVTYTLELRDHRAMTAFVCAPASDQSKRLRWLIVPAPFLLTVGVASQLVESVSSFVLGILALLFWLWVAIKFMRPRAQRMLEPTTGGTILCEYQLTLNADGVEIRTQHWDSLTRWSGVVSVDETPDHVFLRIDNVAAYTVPRRAFPDEDALRRFVSVARAHIAAADQAIS
jgi:hypothetical protein